MTDREIVIKNDMLLKTYSRWMHIKNKGKSISQYFVSNKLNKVAIYGCKDVGLRLMEELNDTDIEIIIGIDKNAEQLDAPVRVVQPIKENKYLWDDVDAIIVTSPYFYNEIYITMRDLGYSGKILSIDDIVLSV